MFGWLVVWMNHRNILTHHEIICPWRLKHQVPSHCQHVNWNFFILFLFFLLFEKIFSDDEIHHRPGETTVNKVIFNHGSSCNRHLMFSEQKPKSVWSEKYLKFTIQSNKKKKKTISSYNFYKLLQKKKESRSGKGRKKKIEVREEKKQKTVTVKQSSIDDCERK